MRYAQEPCTPRPLDPYRILREEPKVAVQEETHQTKADQCSVREVARVELVRAEADPYDSALS